MAQRRSGITALWRYGIKAQWRNGAEAQRLSDSMDRG